MLNIAALTEIAKSLQSPFETISKEVSKENFLVHYRASEEELLEIDKELYLVSNKKMDGFEHGDVVNVTILGVNFKIDCED